MTLSWADVAAKVPRESFIPPVIYRHDRTRAGNDLVPVDRATEPELWAALVAADEPVITQVDNGHPAADGTGTEATSSCSDRSVVREMLELLDPAPGDAVIEIGAGTGWNAALLAAAGARVTSFEIDAELADQARHNLAQAGYGDAVTVVTGDGSKLTQTSGASHLIATVGATTVPASWVRAVVPGGRIVVPLNAAWLSPGLAVLQRTDDGATGHLAGPAAFMSLRSEATSRLRPSTLVPDGAPSSTDVHPYYLTGDRDAAVAIGQRTEGVSFVWRPVADGSEGVLWLYAGESWATIDATDTAPYVVEQAGPRRLVDEVLSAYGWWREAGEPKVGDWHVSVSLDGRQTITL